MKQKFRQYFKLMGVVGVICFNGVWGCVMDAPSVPPLTEAPMILVSGRTVAVIVGDRGRRFGPSVRYVDLTQRQTGQRYRVTIDADDKAFICFLPAGEYDFSRVQISEGPFLSMAQLSSSFSVGDEPLVFLGPWRFGIDSPRYGRMVLVSMVAEDDARQQAEQTVRALHPDLVGETFATVIPSPAETETRLYEVLPYPRYPKYFQRHLW